jgi:hypothetical protein
VVKKLKTAPLAHNLSVVPAIQDVPGGIGQGWQSLDRVAEEGLSEISAEMDEDEIDWFLSLSAAERVRRLYTQSDCDDFAVALHRVTGWPIISAQFPDKELGIGHHTLVKAPSGLLLDAAGWHDQGELKNRLGGKSAKFSEPGGEDTVDSLIDPPGGRDPEEPDYLLARAVSSIRQLPWGPFDSAEFRVMSFRHVPGADYELPEPAMSPLP